MKLKETPVLLVLSLLFVVSLFYSKAGLSISMGLFLLYGLWSQRLSLYAELKSFIKDKAFVGLTLVFFVYLLSGINSSDTGEWLKQVRIKLPFLLLPFAFFLIKTVSERDYKWIHIFLGLLGVLSAVPVLFYYFQNQETVLHALGSGQYLPTPIDHIHYSIILAYAACALLLLLVDGCIYKAKWEGWVSTTLIICLVGILHLLAVRSGLVILYLGLTFVCIWFVYSSKQHLKGVIGLAVIITIPVVGYLTVPSIQSKVGYMVWDLTQYNRGKGKNYSDSERLMSYDLALELIKESPITGQGIGDLKSAMKKKNIENYGEKEKYIFPHNQYLYVLAGLGILGFIFFFGGLLGPVLFYKPDPYIWLVYLSLLAAFMVENTIERAVSTAFFLFFILLGLGRSKEACSILAK